MFPLAAVQAAVFEVPHFFRVPTREHLRHQTIIVRRLISRMSVLKRLPVIGKDLLEDIPVPRGCCNHQGAPSWGVRMFAVKRLYHGSPASSTPHQLLSGHPYPPLSSLSDGDFRERENAFSYTIKQCYRQCSGPSTQLTTPHFCLSTPDSILMSYQKSSRGQRRGAARTMLSLMELNEVTLNGTRTRRNLPSSVGSLATGVHFRSSLPRGVKL